MATPQDERDVAAAKRRYEVGRFDWSDADQAIIDAVHVLISAPRQASNAKAQPADQTAPQTTPSVAGSADATCSIPAKSKE
jgi:hypothetical protein